MDGVLRILDRESKMKDLGVQVDEKLKLGDHIVRYPKPPNSINSTILFTYFIVTHRNAR